MGATLRDVVRVLFLIPAAFLAWWDNWTMWQIFIALDVAWAIGILFDIRKALTDGTYDGVRPVSRYR
jgi:hypothetical protein